MRSCARMSARGWPKLGGGRGGRGVAHLIGVPPVRLFGGQILPPAIFRRCCRALESRSRKYFLAAPREHFGSFDAQPMRLGGAPAFENASYCWSWASIAARPGSSGIFGGCSSSRFWILPLALNFLAEVDAWHWRPHWQRLAPGCGTALSQLPLQLPACGSRSRTCSSSRT